MLMVVACDCGSSESLARQTLHKYSYSGWATLPIHQGKSKSLAKVEELIRKYPDRPDFQALFAHINGNGKWCVVIGYDNDGAKWSDISRKDLKSDIEAEAIINRFA